MWHTHTVTQRFVWQSNCGMQSMRKCKIMSTAIFHWQSHIRTSVCVYTCVLAALTQCNAMKYGDIYVLAFVCNYFCAYIQFAAMSCTHLAINGYSPQFGHFSRLRCFCYLECDIKGRDNHDKFRYCQRVKMNSVLFWRNTKY